MRFRNTCFIIIAMVFLGAAPASAKESPYPEFTKLMHNFHEASTNLTIEILKSAVLIGQSLNTDPNIEGIKTAATAVNEKTKSFEKASNEIREFLNKNEGSLAGSKDIISKIKADSSTQGIAKVNKLASSLSAFAEASSELEFTVYANEGWANSGVTVTPGDLIWVDSKGGWKVSRNYGAAGWKGYICDSSSTYNLNKTAPLGALLFRVRGSSKPDGFSLNENKRGQIDSKGRLEFIINDSDRRNNEGQLDLKVVVLNGDTLKELLQIFQNMEEHTKE